MEYSKFYRTQQSILLVDDDDFVADSLAYVLSDEGYDVTTARNGPAALALMNDKRPDVVICDFMMPQMNGAQLAMEMRASRSYADIPVILCTGAHIAQAKSHVELFNVLMTKPVDLPTLLKHVARLMPSTAAIESTLSCAQSDIDPMMPPANQVDGGSLTASE